MARPPDDAEYAAFVTAQWGSLYRTAFLLVGHRDDAEDLVQTALAKTYASWGRVRDLEAAPAYARTVLVNTATSWFRTRRWRNERPTEVLPEPVVDHDPSTRPAVLSALTALPPRQRATVVLRFYNDLTVAQTAAALGCSEGTVKSQTSVALARLRVLLDDPVLPVPSATDPRRTP